MNRTALWVVPVADLGGVARHVLDTLAAGVPGWRVVLLTPAGPLADRARALGAAVVTADLGPESGTLRSVRAVRRAIARIRPDLVHSHLAYADIATALAAPSGTTLVSTEHGIAADASVYQSGRAGRSVRTGIHTARLRRLSALIAVCESTARVVRQRWSPPVGLPIRVVHNGVDPLPQAPPTTAGLTVGSLSRLAPEKNIPLLIDAFRLVHQRHPEARLQIAGSGPEEQRLREQVTRLGLDPVVTFMGHVDASGFLSDVEVVAQLSAWENHSYTLLDAVNHRRGVVATAVGGNPEIVGPDSLVEPVPEIVADRIISQGLDLGRRPSPGPDWSDVPTMTAAIAEVYAEVTP